MDYDSIYTSNKIHRRETKMTGTFDYKLSDGRTCKLEAKYECVIKPEILDADGYRIKGKAKPTWAGKCDLVAYVDGEKIDSCWNVNFWNLIDLDNGVKKISGLNVGFAKKEDAERYESWIAEIIDEGKSDEVKAYEKAEREKEIKEKVDRAKSVIEKAENQRDIPTKKEAKRRMKQYNDIVNEGGEGYVPYIYSLEEYEYAKKIVSEYEN